MTTPISPDLSEQAQSAYEAFLVLQAMKDQPGKFSEAQIAQQEQLLRAAQEAAVPTFSQSDAEPS